MTTKTITRLERYNDFKVYTKDVDLLGYIVKSSEGIALGVVESLIVDTDTNKLLYIEINTKQHMDSKDNANQLNGDLQNVTEYQEDGEHYMIIPVGASKLLKDNREILVTGYPYAKLAQTPRHRKYDEISPEYELDNLKSYTDKMDTSFESYSEQWGRNYRTASFYKSPLFVNW